MFFYLLHFIPLKLRFTVTIFIHFYIIIILSTGLVHTKIDLVNFRYNCLNKVDIVSNIWPVDLVE